MPYRAAVLAAMLAAFLLSACQTSVSRKDAIDQALYAYEKTLRWQSPREAYRFLRADLQPAYLPPDVDSIRIVGYEVLDPPAEISENVVVQRVQINYVNQNTQIMRTVMDEQVWETDEEGKAWFRTNPVPDFP